MDQVVCIIEEGWVWLETGEPTDGPVRGGVYTVLGHEYHCNQLFYWIAEFPKEDCFSADSFRPVRPISIESLRGLLVPRREKRRESCERE